MIIPKTKIDRFTLEKSKSHLHSIDLIDEDDEEDDGEPSGAGPSGSAPSEAEHINEGEFSSMNDRLGRLEIRVDEGDES